MDNNMTLGDPPGARTQRRWNEQSRHSLKVWRNYFRSIAYARGDPRTVLVPIDRAADMAGLTQMALYFRYLYSGRLPYVVKTWFHGRKRRQKSFVQRAALLELLSRELLEAARVPVPKAQPQASRLSPNYGGRSGAGTRPALAALAAGDS